jgi:hypothetical protein
LFNVNILLMSLLF